MRSYLTIRAAAVAVASFCLLVAVSRFAPSLFAITNGGSIIALGVPLTENFDTLASTGTNIAWTDNSTIAGWYATRTSGAITYSTGTGSSNTGAIYSFGLAGTNPVTDRALGSVGSGGTGVIYWGVKLTNNTGSTITSVDISYVGEQWRNGGATSPNVSVAQGVDFQYQVANAGVITGANAPTTGWVNHDPLDFTSPTFGTTAAAALDGNAAANRVALSSTIAVSVANGQEIWLRWIDIDHAGNDHGMAIDDFSVTGNAAGGSTNPSGTMTASAQSYTPGDPITLTVNVTPGTNPASTGISVTGNLAPIDLGTPAFTDTGNNVFTFTGTIPAGVTGGTKSLTAAIADSQLRSGTTAPPTQISILVPTPPSGSGSATPSTVAPGGTTLLTANVTPGTNPSSTGITVTGDLSAIGIAGPQAFTPNGNTFTYSATVAASTILGAKSLPITVADEQGRSSSFNLSLTVATPVATNIVINEIDADTPGSDTAEFIELYDGGAGHTPLDGLVVVLFDGLSSGSGNQSYAAFDLDGYTTDATGYFVLGNPAVGNASIVFDPGQFGLLQNGADAVALYDGSATDFPIGTVLTTTNLLDAIVYGTDDFNASGLLPLVNPGQKIVNEDATGNAQTQSSQRCPNGMGGFRNTSTYYPGAPTPGTANTCPAARPPSDVVISQIYGGGGNGGATYQNDYVELFNRGPGVVDLTGWTLQYSSATGSAWDLNRQPIGGSIGSGEYYLIQLAAGTGGPGGTPAGAPLPVEPNIISQINISSASGNVALVSSYVGLVGACPVFDPSVKDLVGYGNASCGEGSTTAPGLSNTTAIFRKSNGNQDTDNNANDFAAPATPSPRRTAPIVELGPAVLTTDPATNGINAPRDATIVVTFTEAVTVDNGWFSLTCAVSGSHSSATFAENRGGQDQYVTPNDNFTAGEQCTGTILKDRVHDVDLDDGTPNTDALAADYSWSFTVATGTAPPFPPGIHLAMGNPSGASSGDPDNYLMLKPEFALSYNRDFGRPNWVSWHLSNEWTGTLQRVDTFRADPEVPPDWYRVQSFDFSGSGFDRGHMTPNADRDKETSVPINQATFLMSNMVAQAPDNNQGPWAAFEGYLRTLTDSGIEVFIVSGPAGVGGIGSNIPPMTTQTLADGHVTVPESTWKVALVLPKDSSDPVGRVSCSTRTIAVIMPNVQGIRNDPWENYLTTVDAVETLTGYDLFSNLPLSVQYCVEAGLNGNNPPPDTVAPTVTCAEPDTAWHPEDVALACTASDSTSGLANSADASFSLVASIPAGTEDANASTNSRTICDVAGNCTTVGPIAGNKIDRKAPAITLTTPPNGAIYQLNDIVNAAYSCLEGGSGLTSCTGTAANDTPIDTSSPGTKSFTVNASDAVSNASTATVTYEVKRTLTAIGPARVWIGLPASGDDPFRVDLRADLIVDGIVKASGNLANVSTGGAGFNNALLQTIAVSLSSAGVDVPAGANVVVQIAGRRTCANNGRGSGTVREWYNGQPVDTGSARDAGSRIRMTLGGVATDYFLRSAFALSTTAGTARESVDALLSGQTACPARPFTPLGTWSVILP